MKIFFKKYQYWIIIIVFLVLLIFNLFLENSSDKKISELELNNSKLTSKLDSLNKSKDYVSKVSALQSEIMESTNQELIKNKKHYEDEIFKLDTMSIDDEYEANLRTIREYIEDRKRFNLK